MPTVLLQALPARSSRLKFGIVLPKACWIVRKRLMMPQMDHVFSWFPDRTVHQSYIYTDLHLIKYLQLKRWSFGCRRSPICQAMGCGASLGTEEITIGVTHQRRKGRKSQVQAENANKEYQDKIEFLLSVPLFQRLPQDEHPVVASVCESCRFGRNDVIIRQGARGEEFFVIQTGAADVFVKKTNGQRDKIATLRAGDHFGEGALLRDEPRAATIIAASEVQSLKITRSDFQSLGLHKKLKFGRRAAVSGSEKLNKAKEPVVKTEVEAKLIAEALRTNENLWVFQNLEEKIPELTAVMWKEFVKAGKKLITEGDLEADYFYIVQEGKFEISVREDGLQGSTVMKGPANSVVVGRAAMAEPSAKKARSEFFPSISKIQFEGPQSINPLAFKYYQPDEVIMGKKMRDWCRFAVSWWHTFNGQMGTDPFSNVKTHLRPWDVDASMDTFLTRVDVAFEFFTKLGVDYYCFHDVDVAPQGSSLQEFQSNLDVISDKLLSKQKETGVKLLWATQNLFSHPRYKDGAATSPNFDSFAYGCAQTKKMLDVGKKLDADTHVFWGGREGFATALNTKVKSELDHMAAFLKMAVSYKKKIGFKAQFTIEPKAREPTAHQYDYDAQTVIGFLYQHGLENEFKVNIEPNHTTLAGHDYEHDLRMASALGMLGSIDCNAGQPYLGWDTDEFPSDPRTGLIGACKLVQEGLMKKALEARYSSWTTTALAKKVEDGKASLEEVALLYCSPRAATVRALINAVVWVIDRQQFKDILLKASDVKIQEYRGYLDTVPLLSALLKEERNELAKALIEMVFTQGENIIVQGETGNTFYIMFSGTVDVFKDDQVVATLEASINRKTTQYFGEFALLEDESRTATVQVRSSTVRCLVLDRDSFQKLLGPLKEVIASQRALRKDTLSPQEEKRIDGHALAPDRDKVFMQDLSLVGLLGVGGFSKVELWQHMVTGSTYALKSIDKGLIMHYGMEDTVLSEKKALIMTYSPFIVRLVECFNSDQYLHFLLEPCLGGELLSIFSRSMTRTLHCDMLQARAKAMASGDVPAFSGREPLPPSWDGSDPAALLPAYEKNVMLWQFESDCEKKKQGVKLLRNLTGIARAVADSLSFEEIATENGVDNLLKTLKSHFEPHLELSLPRAFERAVYGPPRSSKESIQEYLIRVERAFVLLSKEGLALDEVAKGYVAYRQAALTEAQDLQFSTWNKGQFDWKTVTSCLRRLEKVVSTKSTGTFLQTDEHEAEEHEVQGEVFVQDDEDVDDDEQYILLEEGDLNRIYEEDEAQLALATYQEVRRALNAQQKGRQYYGGGRSGARGPAGKAKGRGSGAGRRKIHIEELKLRTRCGRCGLLGHWARECVNSPDHKGRQKMAAAASTKSASSSMGSSKAGSAAQSQSWYVSSGADPCSLKKVECCFGFSCRGNARKSSEGFSSDSLNLEEKDGAVLDRLSSQLGLVDRSQDSCFVFEPQAAVVRTTAFFIGLTTNPAFAVVDTAAQDGLIGLGALNRLKVQLSELGLRVAWTNKQARAHGVGGAAKVVGIAAIPLGIGGVSGVLEATVVEGEVPLLLPVSMLKQLEAIIDLQSLCIHFCKLQSTLPLTVLPSGHVAVSVVDFGAEGFQFSPSAALPFTESDFRNPLGPSECADGVMIPKPPSAVSTLCDGSAGSFAATFARSCELSGRGADAARRRASQFEKGYNALASGAGQSGDGPALSLLRGIGAFVASSNFGGGICSNVFRAACRAHQKRREVGSTESQGDSTEASGGVLSPTRAFDHRLKPVCSMGDLYGLPQPMGNAEGREEAQSHQEGEGQTGEGCQPSSGRSSWEEREDDGINASGVQQTERSGEGLSTDVQRAKEPDLKDDRGVEDAAPCRTEEAEDGGLLVERSPGDQGSYDDGICKHGTWERIPGDQGLPRWRDVRVCQTPTGEPEGGANLGSSPARDQSSQPSPLCPDFGRGGLGCDDGGCRSLISIGKCETTSEEGDDSKDEDSIQRCEATWIRLRRAEGVKAEVERLQQSTAFFQVQQVFLEEDAGMFETSVEDLRQEDRSCLLKVTRSARNMLEEDCEEIEETALSKKLKTQLRAAERDAQKDREETAAWQVDVSEVFSPPRVTKEAKLQKMKAGHAFDLKTGFDLRLEKDLKRMREVLQEEEPELVVCSPPCGPFCQIQSLNFPKMATERVMRIVGEGLQHLRTAARVCKRQHLKGKFFVLEHPRGSKAWLEEEIEELKQMDGVFVCKFDMCQFGMRVKDKLNKKPTTILTNSEEIALQLNRVCPGDHEHESLMGGNAALAAEYPRALCQAMLRGLRRQMQKRATQPLPAEEEIVVLATQEEDSEDSSSSTSSSSSDDSSSEAEEEPRQPTRRKLRPEPAEIGVTPEDQVKLRRMHVNLGHPSKPSFLKFLRAGRVREELIRWVAKEFSCSTCASTTMPKAPRPAIVPRCYAPGVAVGLDVFYIPDVTNQRTVPVLNLLDLGTNYQAVELLESKEPVHIWRTFWRVWGRVFGLPQYITVDEGREFRGGFSRICADAGVVVFNAAARAPWQQGKVERHGGLMKSLLEKGREEAPPTNREDLSQLLHECEAAKNRFSNRSGYSPTQRQIGQWPRMPSSLLSDDAIDPALQAQGDTDEFERMMEMRRVAQNAFMKLSCKEAAARALKARPRVQQTYKAGDLVYVFRVLRRQKALRHGEGPRRGQPKSKWVGPGKVLAVEGAVVWINMLGELWRAAVEQVRSATTEEKMGAEVISEECEEMQERLKRSSHRAGYRDITGQPFPGDEENEGSEDPVRAEGEQRGQPRARLTVESASGQVAGERIAPAPAVRIEEEERVGRHTSDPTEFEPEGEASARHTAQPTPALGPMLEDPGGPAITDDLEDSLDREIERAAVATVAQNQRMDGIPERGYSALRRDVRGQWRRSSENPYFSEFFFTGDDCKEPEAEEPTKDYWVFDQHREVLQRHHVVWRKALFNPAQAEASPVPLRALRKQRKTLRKLSDGTEAELEDEWSLFCAKEERLTWWKGVTEFSVDPHFLVASNKEHGPKKKRGEGEVFPHEIPDAEWPEWRKQDAEEFQKIVDSGALRILSVEESREVRKQLEATGKLNRIIPSRMVRRYKPGEGPGAPRSFKSRFCIRGDKDPDILSLARFAPTVTTSNLQIIFQVAANKRFRGVVGDLKAAFTQSRPLVRSEGPLYCRSCHGSMPGLEEEQLAEIVLGCYGLVDAPLNWRITLTEFVQKELKYRQSSLDPFKFGKLKEIGEEGVDFNGRRLRKEGDAFLIDMQAFVEERLHQVPLPSARKKEKKDEVTEEERSQVRSVCGALNWAGREGRPDAAAAASMFSSLVSTMKVEDVIELNKVVEQLKSDSSLALRIQPIAEERLRWGVISDASWATARNGKTQAGHMLIAFDRALLEGKEATTNLLHWRSGKLQRTVNSTLAAETQSLARGVGDLLWMMIVYMELIKPDFHVREWRKYVGRLGYNAFTKVAETETLEDALALVDAKSLYDLLINETTGGSDRRNALDVQALREELKELRGQIRWVEHLEMPADCLTKKQGKVATLKKLLSEGKFGITEEKGFWGSVPHSRYYTAGAALALEHMHERRIVYRDLKPENVVLDQNGHMKVTDLGLAKLIIGKTYTTCGTPEYFAPEVISLSGQTLLVDWWTLGVFLYELLCSTTPFMAPHPMQIYAKVMRGIDKNIFPGSCAGSPELFIKGLLRQQPGERLPARQGGMKNLKEHDFFEAFDWNGMKANKLDPPYTPEVADEKDVSNFFADPKDISEPQVYKDPDNGWDEDFATVE
eukprot:s740_g21.t1